MSAVASQQRPYSTEVERALIGRMLTHPHAVADVMGRYVTKDDFRTAECRLLFEKITEAHMSGSVDPVIIGERARKPLAEIWSIPEHEVSSALRALANSATGIMEVPQHVEMLKSLSARRRIIDVAEKAIEAARASDDPAQVGMGLADMLTEIAVGGQARSRILTRKDNVEGYVSDLKMRVRVLASGGELGVMTGYRFFDRKVAGIQPGEVVMLAGEPGVGKSAVAQTLARGFAKRQLDRPPQNRIGTLTINLEMTRFVDMSRDAQMLTGIDGHTLRRAEVTTQDFQQLGKAYVAERFRELPLYVNYASRLNASGLRALCIDALNRGYNTGFLIIDHFRMWDLDKGMVSRDAGANQVDEEKARFLKELAKDLNIAILCLAHTVKMDKMSDGRPQMSDLRGSYQVAAYCDVVAFVYQPWMYATPTERDTGIVPDTRAELIVAKNRNGRRGDEELYFDGKKMEVRDIAASAAMP